MRRPCLLRSLAAAWLLLVALAIPAAAGDPPPGQAAPAADPDLDVNVVQPDFAISALATTLRLPRHRLSFRLTHRFNAPLDQSGAGDLFGMDAGAQMGFELRYGLARGAQVGVYAEPLWVNHTNVEPSSRFPESSTTILGLGVRVRVMPTTYLTAEIAPRIGGFAPGAMHAALGIEKRAGGHLFQITIANNQGTTLAHVARGGPAGNDWYLGFNLSRKFYRTETRRR